MKVIFTYFIIVFFLISFSNVSFSQAAKKFINPTGTYSLDNKTTKRNGEIYGYFGKIQVQLIDSNKIIITFFINRGAPSYNSGSFVKTLFFDGATAVYTEPDSTNECMTTFIFSNQGVDVFENPDVKQLCWGFRVVATGYFKKKSSRKPVLRDPLTDELITDDYDY